MKQIFTIALLFTSVCASAQVKLGTNPNTISSAAILELEDTAKGILIPRMTAAQRLAMTDVPRGLMVYQTNGSMGFYYNVSAQLGSPSWKRLTPEDESYWDRNNSGELYYSSNTPNVGINTKNPDYPLHLFATNNGFVQTDTLPANDVSMGTYVNGSAGWLQTYTNHPLYFATNNGSADMVLATDGSVGIGTATPGYLLDVAGRMRLRSGGAGTTSGLWYNKAANSEGAFTGMVNDTTWGIWGNGTSGNWQAVWDLKNGRSVIGNTVADKRAKFIVDSKEGAVHAIFGSNTTGLAFESSYPGIGFNTYYNAGRKYVATGYGGYIGVDPVSGGMTLNVTATSGSTNAAATLTDGIKIAPDGNVGIGDNAPAYPLSVKNSGDGIVQQDANGTVKVGTYTNSAGGWLQTYSNHPLLFTTNNSTQQMTLGTSGNLAIGTTPDASYKLKLQGASSIMQADGTVTFTSGITSTGALFKTTSNHAIQFAVNNNTPSVTIRNTGNVGIGTALPGAKLEVIGASGTGIRAESDVVAVRAVASDPAGSAMEISGQVKVSSSNRFAYVLTCNANNMTDAFTPEVNYSPGSYFKSVIIDNATSNGDPDAIIMVTPRNWPSGSSIPPFAVAYDAGLQKWKITIHAGMMADNGCVGLATLNTPNCGGNYSVAVTDYHAAYIVTGAQFNVMIVKQ